MRRMGFGCWIPAATDTHSEYVTLLVLTRHHWLQERVLMLRFVRTWRVLHFYACSTESALNFH